MKRWPRVLLAVLAPPALGATGFWWFVLGGNVVDAMEGRRRFSPLEMGQAWLVMVLFAYFFAGLPSLAYAAIMEWRYVRGLDPASWRAVAWSTGLGALSGAAMVAVMSGGVFDHYALLIWCVLGLAVGFLLGLFVRWRSRAG